MNKNLYRLIFDKKFGHRIRVRWSADGKTAMVSGDVAAMGMAPGQMLELVDSSSRMLRYRLQDPAKHTKLELSIDRLTGAVFYRQEWLGGTGAERRVLRRAGHGWGMQAAGKPVVGSEVASSL